MQGAKSRTASCVPGQACRQHVRYDNVPELMQAAAVSVVTLQVGHSLSNPSHTTQSHLPVLTLTLMSSSHVNVST
jgi:hypothetical protein